MIELKGKLDFHSKKVREALRFALKNTLLECGVRASSQAKMLAPVRTGRLRASIGPTAVLPSDDMSYLKGSLSQKGLKGKAQENTIQFININWTPEDFEKLGAYKQEGDLRALIIVGTNVKYAPYVEFGTYKSAPHPYLGPAMHLEGNKMKNYVPASFKKYFEERARQLGLKNEK